MSNFKPMMGRFSRAAPQDGTVLSVQYLAACALSPQEAVQRLQELFQRITPLVLTEHVILGHLKGAIQWENALLTMSVTREDVFDVAGNTAWENCDVIQNPLITVNLMSILPVPLTQEQLSDAVVQAFQP